MVYCSWHSTPVETSRNFTLWAKRAVFFSGQNKRAFIVSRGLIFRVALALDLCHKWQVLLCKTNRGMNLGSICGSMNFPLLGLGRVMARAYVGVKCIVLML